MRQIRRISLLFVSVLMLSTTSFAQTAPQAQAQPSETLEATVKQLQSRLTALEQYVGKPEQLSGIARDLTGAAVLFDRRDHQARNRLILVEEWQVAVEGSLLPFTANVPNTPAKRRGTQSENYELIRYLQRVVKRLQNEEGAEKAMAELNRLVAHRLGEIQRINHGK